MARAAAASRTQEERTEEARARLRSAALELFASEGYTAPSMAAISLRAGYSRTLAQYHFADKAALAMDLIRDRLRRDNQVELLDCPAEAPAEAAWAALIAHLDAVTDHYTMLHGLNDHGTRVRGEMAIHAAALMGSDPAISAAVDSSTRDLIARIERLLARCKAGGLIRPETDAHAMAVLHVHSIWGLALALFANPKGTRAIKTAFSQIRLLLEALRT